MKFFKEPLVHFLLLGAGLFVLFSFLNKGSSDERGEIIVTQGHIEALALGFEKVWQRSPSEEELDSLIQNYIREEVLYREALAMGLDKEDAIIKRRLCQKIEFLSEDLADLNAPETKELQAYLEAHQEDYRQPTRFSFRQVYFNTSKRGQSARADAITLLGQLKDSDANAEKLGDPLILQYQFENETEREVERALGRQFLQSLRETPTGNWQGPIPSGFGLHLVFIYERVDGDIPELNEVRDVVIRDWTLIKRKQVNEAFYETLRKRYIVKVKSEK